MGANGVVEVTLHQCGRGGHARRSSVKSCWVGGTGKVKGKGEGLPWHSKVKGSSLKFVRSIANRVRANINSLNSMAFFGPICYHILFSLVLYSTF